jgi:hypothetical protein
MTISLLLWAGFALCALLFVAREFQSKHAVSSRVTAAQVGGDLVFLLLLVTAFHSVLGNGSLPLFSMLLLGIIPAAAVIGLREAARRFTKPLRSSRRFLTHSTAGWIALCGVAVATTFLFPNVYLGVLVDTILLVLLVWSLRTNTSHALFFAASIGMAWFGLFIIYLLVVGGNEVVIAKSSDTIEASTSRDLSVLLSMFALATALAIGLAKKP